MRVPFSWLREYVEVDAAPAAVADKLTFSGTEVEGLETVGSHFEGIVVGEVRAVRPHPNADRLTLCTVWSGRDALDVVCGAPNVRPGMKSALAPVGVTLPNGVKLKRAKIRGVESLGMLCAEDELGLSDHHGGILSIEGDWPAGTPLVEVLGPPETILKLEITPNRPDCLSLIGIAREVAALYRLPLKLPDVTFPESAPPVEERARVTVEDPAGCPRYTARVIDGIGIGPAPHWMQRRLRLAGIRPINNVVDITNYVLLECGQPLHAFDLSLLRGNQIVVRRARAGERMTTLDGVERRLTPDLLLIADEEQPVAVAGVMGGIGSEIREATKIILLESARFAPLDVRAASRKLGLSTESSYRFERGVDILQVDWASRRAAALLAQLAGGRTAAGVIDIFPQPPAPRLIRCRAGRVKALLGITPAPGEVEQVFVSLGLPVTASSPEVCTVEAPAHRPDLEREVDLIEEFARLHGLDNLPAPAPASRVVPGAHDAATRAGASLRADLRGLGLTEIMNYSLVSAALLDRFGEDDRDRRIRLPHPLTEDQSVLRTSLVPQLVETLGHNHNRQIRTLAAYELGRVYFKLGAGSGEETRLAVGFLGPVGRTGLNTRAPVEPDEAFLWMKGLWESLAAARRLTGWTTSPHRAPAFREGYAVGIRRGDVTVGRLGVLAPVLLRHWRIAEPVAVLEVEAAPLLGLDVERSPLRRPAAFPAISRDAAMVVGEAVTHQAILDVVRKAAPLDLEQVELFDVFRGPHLGAGRKSMAYSFTYRSAARTLTDEEANRYHEAVKSALKKELEVEIREG